MIFPFPHSLKKSTHHFLSWGKRKLRLPPSHWLSLGRNPGLSLSHLQMKGFYGNRGQSTAKSNRRKGTLELHLVGIPTIPTWDKEQQPWRTTARQNLKIWKNTHKPPQKTPNTHSTPNQTKPLTWLHRQNGNPRTQEEYFPDNPFNRLIQVAIFQRSLNSPCISKLFWKWQAQDRDGQH